MEPPPPRQQPRVSDQPQRHRRRSSVYDYTRRMLSRGLGQRPTVNTTVAANRATERIQMNYSSSSSSISPQSGGSPSPLISISDGKAARRRWYFLIAIGFVVSVLINIGSTLFVVNRLREAALRNRNTADDYLMENFQDQGGNYEVLQYVRAWKRHSWYLEGADNEGRNRDPDIEHEPMHATLVDCQKNTADGKLKHWKTDGIRLKSCSIQYNSTTGEFIANETGLYQVYSNLAFKPPMTATNNTIEFVQNILLDDNSTPLFQERQHMMCQDSRLHELSCYTSVIFGTVHLNVGQRLQVAAQPYDRVSCLHQHSFFGLVKLN